jgi:hypothetical protein
MKFLDIKYQIIALIFVSGLGACTKSYLDVVPDDQLSSATFWKTKEDAAMALAGCYRGWENGMNIVVGDAMTDNDYSHMTVTGYQQVGNGSVSPQNVLVGTGARAFSYVQIRKYNNFLENVQQMTALDDAEKQKMMAEVRFLRAYDYFLKVMFFGDMPLITQTIPSTELPARTPASEIQAFILSELAEISNVLPVQNVIESKGHITKGAALALKARMELFMGKFPEALVSSKAVIDMGVYELYPNYEELFYRQNSGSNKESIAEVQHIFNDYSTTIPWQRLPSWKGGYAESGVSKTLVDEYETSNGLPINMDPSYDPDHPFDNRDPRLKMTVALPGSMWFGRIYTALNPQIDGVSNPDYYLNDGSKAGQMGKKYLDPEIQNAERQNFDANIMVIRLAEMYLTFAEAAVETGQDLDLALDYINLLRERAGHVPATALTRELVRRERRVELALEGLRYYDIERWDLGPTVMNGPYYGSRLGSVNTTTGEVTWGTGYILVEKRNFYPERKYLLPIPQSELDVNPNMTQNPGYN